MKKLTFTFLALVLAISCFAQDIASAVAAQVNTATRARQAEKTAFATENALKALIARQNPANWQEISWKEFLEQNKHTQEVEICSVNIDAESNRQCQQLAGPDFTLPTRRGQGPFDYASIVKGQKIIYIGESHNTTNIPAEVETILKAVRENNPRARILLASEFINWMPIFPLTDIPAFKQTYNEGLLLLRDFYLHPERYDTTKMSAFQQSMADMDKLLQRANTFINKPFLLKKANTQSEHLEILGNYDSIFQTADALDIDQLALDDIICLEDPEVAKIGGVVVRTNEKDSINQYVKDSGLSFLELLSVSSLGVRERNREWARRIKAVLPIYDIVVVHAGSGHLHNTYSVDLPPMVGIKKYTSITLVSKNVMSEKDERWYEKRDQSAQQNGLSQDGKMQQLTQKATELPMFSKEVFDEWKDHTQPFWFLSTTKEEDQIFQSIREFSGDEAAEAYIKRYNAAFPVREENFLFISLPDK